MSQGAREMEGYSTYRDYLSGLPVEKFVCRGEEFHAPADERCRIRLRAWFQGQMHPTFIEQTTRTTDFPAGASCTFDLSTEEPLLIKQVVAMALTGDYQVPTEFGTREITTSIDQREEEGGQHSMRVGGDQDTEFLRTSVYFHILMYCLTRRYCIVPVQMRSWSKMVGALNRDIKWLPATIREVYTSPTFPADDLSLRKVVVNLSKGIKLGDQSMDTLTILNDAVFEEISAFKRDLSMAIM